MDCLNSECTSIGFNLWSVINSAIRNHEAEVSGTMRCHGNEAPDHTEQSCDGSLKYTIRLRAGTSIGANNAEACNAISKADFKSKSYIALKEARESLYWLELLHRNNYLTDEQYKSIYSDAEELVKILVSRCKKLDEQLREEKK